jgi:ABC-type transporter Mla subunit MlaD
MPEPLDHDPVPTEVRAIIDLFTTQLAKVTFPDVDAASLRKQADELRAEAKNVERAREALAAAVATADARLAALKQTAARAVAYARVYSDAHVERQPLAAALAELARPADGDAATTIGKTGKRRGRPPRATADHSAELFDAASAPELSPA